MSRAELPACGPCTPEQHAGQGTYDDYDKAVRPFFAAGQRVRNRWISSRRLGTIEMVAFANPHPGGGPLSCISHAIVNWDPSDTTPINRTEIWLGDLVIVDADGFDLAPALQPPLPPGERAPGAPAEAVA